MSRHGSANISSLPPAGVAFPLGVPRRHCTRIRPAPEHADTGSCPTRRADRPSATPACRHRPAVPARLSFSRSPRLSQPASLTVHANNRSTIPLSGESCGTLKLICFSDTKSSPASLSPINTWTPQARWDRSPYRPTFDPAAAGLAFRAAADPRRLTMTFRAATGAARRSTCARREQGSLRSRSPRTTPAALNSGRGSAPKPRAGSDRPRTSSAAAGMSSREIRCRFHPVRSFAGPGRFRRRHDTT